MSRAFHSPAALEDVESDVTAAPPQPLPVQPRPARRGPHGAWHAAPAFWTLQASHVVIDVYPIFFASLMLALRDRLGLDAWQIAVLYATGPVVSGVPQIFFAWLTDRLDSRIFGWLGLAIGALCMCSIGFTQNFWQLWALQIVGMLATGSFHPIGAALAGHLGGRMRGRTGRAWGVSVFYTAGMVGGFAGAFLCTRINGWLGMPHLAWLVIPGFALALMLWAATHALPHRHANHHALHGAVDPAQMRQRWYVVGLLFCQNMLRFTVNTGLPILFAVWAESRLHGDVAAATNLNGNVLAALTLGMGVFGLSARRLSPQGSERRSLVILSLAGAVSVALCGYVSSWLGPWGMYLMAALSALGFAAIIPTTISLAQRLLPGRTGLASGLMLGTAWGLSFTAPWLSEWFLGARIDQAHELDPDRINIAFVGFAMLLILAAGLSAIMPSRLLRAVADAH